MQAWQIGAVANAVVAVAYLAICRAIAVPLVRAGELRSNKLGAATALIFLTCAVHHGAHSVHMLLPYAHLGEKQGLAMRAAFDGWSVTWDLVTAAVGSYYWTLRRSYGRLLTGSQLFEDHQQRQRDAMQINDLIVQALVAAQLARAAGRDAELDAALSGALKASREVVDQLLMDTAVAVRPGDFVREAPAELGRP